MKLTVVKLLIAVVVGVFLVKLSAIVYDRYFAEGASPDRTIYVSRGIDLSHHNGRMDFERLSKADTDVEFVYLKATEGTDYVDPEFVAAATACRRYGIPAGAYHFFRYDTDGELQALNFMQALRGRHFQLPPAIDVEDWGNPDGHATAKIVERLRALTEHLLSEGYTPVIYTNSDGYRRFIKGNFDHLPLWIASFDFPPLEDDPENSRWSLWQYSHRGSVPGIFSSVDLNVVNPANPLPGLAEQTPPFPPDSARISL